MFNQLNQILKSKIKSLEFLSLINNLKPSIRILCHEDNQESLLSIINKNKLFFSKSDFKIQKDINNNYSDKSFKITNDKKGYFIFYISKNKTEELKELEINNNHKELGLKLGYPKCCCDFFNKNFNTNNTDLTLDILNNSLGYIFPFQTNIAARHFDFNLISHFPCSFNCEESLKIANNNLKLINHDFNFLKSIILYSKEHGIFLINNYTKEENKIKFNSIKNTSTNKLYYFLNESKEFEIIDKNNIKIQNDLINIGVMIFN